MAEYAATLRMWLTFRVPLSVEVSDHCGPFVVVDSAAVDPYLSCGLKAWIAGDKKPVVLHRNIKNRDSPRSASDGDIVDTTGDLGPGLFDARIVRGCLDEIPEADHVGSLLS